MPKELCTVVHHESRQGNASPTVSRNAPPPMPNDELPRIMLAALEEYFRAHPEAAQSISGLARDAVRAMPPVPQTVTLLQASVLCRRSKKTLERLKSDGDFPLEVNPLRRSGQPCFYRWAELRAFLIKKLGIQLPEQFPTLSDEVA